MQQHEPENINPHNLPLEIWVRSDLLRQFGVNHPLALATQELPSFTVPHSAPLSIKILTQVLKKCMLICVPVMWRKWWDANFEFV